MLNKIFLLILKHRLKRYKRDAKWYEKEGNYNNFYHEKGIPDLIKEIYNLEMTINNANKKKGL
jgi:hypothetical protein